VKTVRIWRWH